MRLKRLYDDLKYVSNVGTVDDAANKIDRESLKIIYEYCPDQDRLQNFCRSVTQKITYAVEFNRNRTGQDSWRTELTIYDNPNIAGTFSLNNKERAQNIVYLITQTKEKVAAVETHESIHALSDKNARQLYAPQKYLRFRQSIPIEIIEGCTEGWNDYIWNHKSNTYVQYKEIVNDMAGSFGLPAHKIAEIYKNGHYGLLLGLLLLYQNRGGHYEFLSLKHLPASVIQQIRISAETEIHQYPSVLEAFQGE
jgi:hypothetical protein